MPVEAELPAATSWEKNWERNWEKNLEKNWEKNWQEIRWRWNGKREEAENTWKCMSAKKKRKEIWERNAAQGSRVTSVKGAVHRNTKTLSQSVSAASQREETRNRQHHMPPPAPLPQ